MFKIQSKITKLYPQYVSKFISNFWKILIFLGQTKKCVVNTHEVGVVSTHSDFWRKKLMKN